MRPSVTLVGCCFALTAGAIIATPTLEARAGDNVIELVATKKDNAKLVLSDDVTFAIPEEIGVLSGSALKTKADFHFRALNPKSKTYHCIDNGEAPGFWTKLISKITGKSRESILAFNTDVGAEPTATPPPEEINQAFLDTCSILPKNALESEDPRIRTVSSLMFSVNEEDGNCDSAHAKLIQKSKVTFPAYRIRSVNEKGVIYAVSDRGPSHFTVDISVIIGFKNIEYFTCSFCGITDLTPIADNLKDLKQIGITGNPISDITPLLRLKQLKSISLKGTDIHDIRPLFALPLLEFLDVSQTQLEFGCPTEPTSFKCFE